ncbi:T9SS type A sorting domain-containing protein [Marinilabilia rubra]|nr:T9SS type A sorting domain-containing protein [Marinilabilia rubra]
MKRIFTTLLLSGMILFPGLTNAQTDITPSRYDFSAQPLGAFSLDKQVAGANPPASDPDVIDHWNNGFISVGNPNMLNSTEFTDGGQGAILNSFFQIYDMGGDVGKVLMMKGNGSEYEYGTPGDPGFWLGWWNMSIYTDKDLTTSVAEQIDLGNDEATAEELATVRLRIVFHIHQNEISTTNKLFDILGYTYTNNHKQDESGTLDATVEFKSGDFTETTLDPITFEPVSTYAPDKWIACEYDFVAPEEPGTPLRFTLRFGGNANNTTLMIKEITMTANPTGEPMETEELTLAADPVATSVNPVESENSFTAYSAQGRLTLENVKVGSEVTIYSMTGSIVEMATAHVPSLSFSLPNGMYIVKAGTETQKVVVQ